MAYVRPVFKYVGQQESVYKLDCYPHERRSHYLHASKSGINKVSLSGPISHAPHPQLPATDMINQ